MPMHRLPTILFVVALAWAPSVRAAGASPAEVTFWTGAQQDNSAASYRAYLEAFPNGTFASLAQRRLARLAEVPAPAAPALAAPALATQPAPAPPAQSAAVWVRPAKASIRVVDGVSVDLDASRLRSDGNWRVAVVPAGWPDGPPPDRNWFLDISVAVPPTLFRVVVPAGPAGQDQVRLYWIPRYEDDYRVAARAPITVQPGVDGAVLMRDLSHEAQALGPIRFEAAHRDRPMLIQAAFLRIQPQTEWNLAWFGGRVVDIGTPAAAINVGQVGAVPDQFGSRHEGICLLPAGGAMLDRLAGLEPGEPVLLRAVPTSWSNADKASPVLLDRCELLPAPG